MESYQQEDGFPEITNRMTSLLGDSLDDIKQNIIKSIQSRYDDYSSITEKMNQTLADIESQKSALNSEYQSLGIFKGKRKQEIQDELESLEKKILQAKAKCESKKESVE